MGTRTAGPHFLFVSAFARGKTPRELSHADSVRAASAMSARPIRSAIRRGGPKTRPCNNAKMFLFAAKTAQLSRKIFIQL